MDTHTSSRVQRKKGNKKSKPKKNPIKVVYISNPMRVETSAAEFRALVQELTGQDAELPPVPTRFSDRSVGIHVGGSDHGGNLSVSGCLMSKDGYAVMNQEHDREVDEVPLVVELSPQDHHQPAQGSSSERFEQLDEDYTPQMIEKFSGFSPATVFYESAQMDHVLRSFGIM